MRVVGAGVGRTGTSSLKGALERLLGGPCYHMWEVLQRDGDAARWQRAYEGEALDWRAFYEGWAATVDWPGAGFWKPISDAFPDAVILLSRRSSADVWFASADATILRGMRQIDDATPWERMARAMMTPFCSPAADEETAKAAYERHNAEVIATADPARLLIWEPGDGWEPLCERLGVPIPDEPFPHDNSTEAFQARFPRTR